MIEKNPALVAISALIFLVFFVPQRYGIGSLGFVGSPSIILALVLAFWWFQTVASGGQDAWRALTATPVAFLWVSALAASAAGWSRPLPVLEASAINRSLVWWLAYGGVALFVATECQQASLSRVLRRLVVGATYLALVGLLQFSLRLDLSHIAGLFFEESTIPTKTLLRGGLIRVAGSTKHPIEFGVTLAAVLPLALHLALSEVDRGAVSRWVPPIAIAAGLTLSLSRAALLGGAVGVLWLLPSLTPSRRRRLALVLVGAGLITFVVAPGVGRVLAASLHNISTDPSIQSRTADYALLDRFALEHLWFGRGPGTLLPDRYAYIDNQYLLTLIEHGVFGVLALVTAFVVSLRSAWRSPGVGHALGGSIAVHAVTFVTYDALRFPTASFTLFIAIGLLGAAQGASRVRSSSRPPDPVHQRGAQAVAP